ncbi:hypothetical protein ACTA71_007686 [Dictyostelium dimigraforme]
MKLLLHILISLIFIIVLVRGSDYCMKCYDEGAKCAFLKSDGSYDVGGCVDNLVCGPLNNKTTIENFVCRPFSKKNEECFSFSGSDAGICVMGLVCVNDKCSNAHFSSIGEACEQQTDCISNFATCTNKICTNPTNECKNEDDCGYSQYCQSNVCTPRINPGKNCTIYGDEMCIQPLICQEAYKDEEFIGTCQTPIQNGIGGNCNIDTNCNINDGLYCNNGICEEYVEPIQKGNCTTDASICDQYHSCDCQGKCYAQFTPLTKINSSIPFEKCVSENQCRFDGNVLSSSSCISKNCGKQLCTFLKVSYGVSGDTVCPNVKYSLDQYCGTSSKISYSLFSLLLLLIISLLF